MANNGLEVFKYQVDGKEISLDYSTVKKYIANNSDITDSEYVLFCNLCVARGLNPFTKEVYLIKFGNNPAQIVVSKDAFLKRAEKNPQFNGIEDGVIVEKANGDIDYLKGTFFPKSAKLVGGWATVYRKDQAHPKSVTVNLQEYMKKGNWLTMPAVMINKVAKASALREAFPNDLSQLYDESEIVNEDMNTVHYTSQGASKEPAEPKNDVIDAEFRSSNLKAESVNANPATATQLDNIEKNVDTILIAKKLQEFGLETIKDLTLEQASAILKLHYLSSTIKSKLDEKNLKQMLAYYKVNTIYDLTVTQLNEIIGMITK